MKFRLLLSIIVLLGVFLLNPSPAQAGTSTISGKVIKPDSAVLEGAEIMLHTSNWSVSQWSTSDSNGLFSFSGLDAGTYIMEFRTPWNNSSGLIEPDAVTSVVADGATFYRNGVDGTDCSGAACPAIQFSSANNTISGTLTKANGNPISGAYVEAYKEMGMSWVRATTDSNGAYSMSIGSGNWMVSPRANYGADPSTVDWTYTKMPTRVSFTSNVSPGTTKTTNFTAQTADCQITGSVKDPNGNTLSGVNYLSVSVWSRDGGGQSAATAADGSFSLKVPAGTYQMDVFAWGSDYGSPSTAKFTVKDADGNGTCDAYNAGTLRLVARNSTISGTVLDDSGNPIANTQVSAWKYNASGWANATTNASGVYSMSVTSGTWIVSVMADPGMYGGGYGSGTTYINDQAPQQVTVADSATSSGNNFTLKVANSTVSGRVVNSDGTTLTSLEMGYAYVETGSSNSGPGPMMFSTIGAPVKDGIFTLKVPAGTYNIGVTMPPGAGYCTGSATSVTATANATSSATITVTSANGTLSGYLKKDSDSGSTITGVRADVFANSGTMNFGMATVDSTSGAYTMSLCPGAWNVGYWIDPSLTDGESNSYLSQPPSDNQVTITASQTTTKNIIVKKADATIAGKVKDPDGSGMAGVWVSLDTRSNENVGSFNRDSMFHNGSMTDSDGDYSIKVPSGTTYYVEAFLPGTSSYISPARVGVTPTSGQTVTTNLQFTNADATLTGTVTQGGTARQAFVSAWSENGGFASTSSGSNGSYTLSISTGTNWHVKAMYESGTSFAKSSEQIVSPTSGSNSLNLDLSSSGSMPDSTTATYSASNQKTITLSDGTTINIPAGALASSGNVTVTVTPKAQLPTQSLASPVNIGYTITALDSNGAEITSNFSSNVTIVMPYSEATLTSLGITENDLLAGYWDPATNSWRTADNISIDTTNNTITVTINHFTDFAPFSAGKTGSASSSSTSTSTSTSTVTSVTNVPAVPEIHVGEGATIDKGSVIAIVQKGTLKNDSYLSVTTHGKKHPYRVSGLWQVSDVYDVWYKTMDNGTKIYFPDKTAIWAFRYSSSQLEKMPESSLKIAYSADAGKTWKVVKSILDKNNKTISTITKNGGYYMLVAGYGKSSTLASGNANTKGKVLSATDIAPRTLIKNWSSTLLQEVKNAFLKK